MAKKRKILKIAFSVVTIACVIMSMVTPAMAYGIQNGYGIGGGWYHGALAGSVRFYPQPPDEFSGRMFQYDLNVYNDYGTLSQNDYTYMGCVINKLYANNSGYESAVNIYHTRKAEQINGARYWSVRSLLRMKEGTTDTSFLTSDGYTFTFNSFAIKYSQPVFARLFSYYSAVPSIVTVSYTELGNDGISFTYKDEYKYGGDGWVYPLTEISNYIAEYTENQQPFLVTQLTVDIKQYTDTTYTTTLYSDGLQFGVLTQQYTDEAQLPNLLGGYTVADYWYELSQNIDNRPSAPDVEDNAFVRFVASSVVSFFSVELFPGFSLGGVLGIILGVCIILIILKFFGGG